MNIPRSALVATLTVAMVATSHAQKEATQPDSLEGVTPHEMTVLRVHYRWKKADKLPSAYPLEELYKIMDDSADNTLELEDYDWQARKLVVALMVLGDKAFAKELDGRAVPVQQAAIAMLNPLWEKYRLHYPATEEIAAALRHLPK